MTVRYIKHGQGDRGGNIPAQTYKPITLTEYQKQLIGYDPEKDNKKKKTVTENVENKKNVNILEKSDHSGKIATK